MQRGVDMAFNFNKLYRRFQQTRHNSELGIMPQRMDSFSSCDVGSLFRSVIDFLSSTDVHRLMRISSGK